MDIEKTMQFILDTQAKHEIAIQQWDERFLKFQREMDRFQQETGQRFSTLVDVCMSLTRHGEETDRRLQETDRLIRELRDAQSETDGKLHALIDTVDKLVKGDGGRK